MKKGNSLSKIKFKFPTFFDRDPRALTPEEEAASFVIDSAYPFPRKEIEALQSLLFSKKKKGAWWHPFYGQAPLCQHAKKLLHDKLDELKKDKSNRFRVPHEMWEQLTFQLEQNPRVKHSEFCARLFRQAFIPFTSKFSQPLKTIRCDIQVGDSHQGLFAKRFARELRICQEVHLDFEHLNPHLKPFWAGLLQQDREKALCPLFRIHYIIHICARRKKVQLVDCVFKVNQFMLKQIEAQYAEPADPTQTTKKRVTWAAQPTSDQSTCEHETQPVSKWTIDRSLSYSPKGLRQLNQTLFSKDRPNKWWHYFFSNEPQCQQAQHALQKKVDHLCQAKFNRLKIPDAIWGQLNFQFKHNPNVKGSAFISTLFRNGLQALEVKLNHPLSTASCQIELNPSKHRANSSARELTICQEVHWDLLKLDPKLSKFLDTLKHNLEDTDSDPQNEEIRKVIQQPLFRVHYRFDLKPFQNGKRLNLLEFTVETHTELLSLTQKLLQQQQVLTPQGWQIHEENSPVANAPLPSVGSKALDKDDHPRGDLGHASLPTPSPHLNQNKPKLGALITPDSSKVIVLGPDPHTLDQQPMPTDGQAQSTKGRTPRAVQRLLQDNRALRKKNTRLQEEVNKTKALLKKRHHTPSRCSKENAIKSMPIYTSQDEKKKTKLIKDQKKVIEGYQKIESKIKSSIKKLNKDVASTKKQTKEANKKKEKAKKTIKGIYNRGFFSKCVEALQTLYLQIKNFFMRLFYGRQPQTFFDWQTQEMNGTTKTHRKKANKPHSMSSKHTKPKGVLPAFASKGTSKTKSRKLKWVLKTKKINDNEIRCRLMDHKNQPVSYQRFLEALQSDPAFVDHWIDTLKACPFPHIYWECIVVNQSRLPHQHFECVFTRATALGAISKADPSSFKAHLQKDQKATSFFNLSQDTLLVCPNTGSNQAEHFHSLASFTRHAPKAQQHVFWRTVAEKAQQRIQKMGQAPIWLSTHGTGVPWLHVRIASRPKYYHHKAYTSAQLKKARDKAAA